MGDDFLNVRGPTLGDAGKMVLPTKEPVQKTVVPPAPASPSVQSPMLFGRNPAAISNQVVKLGGAMGANKARDEEEDEEDYSDDDEFEDDEDEDEAFLAPENTKQVEGPRTRFR